MKRNKITKVNPKHVNKFKQLYPRQKPGQGPATLNLHVSGLNSFQNCERSWFYEYILGYKNPTDNDAITVGNWGHYCLRLVAQGQQYMEAIAATHARQWELDPTYFDDPQKEALWEMFENLMYAHEAWQRDSGNLYTDGNLEYVSLEKEFNLEQGRYKFGGQWDGLARHKQLNGLFLIERKFTRDPNNLEKGINWDYQPRFYAWAVEQLLGEPVVGVIYEIVRRCDPTKVKLLTSKNKAGLPSKAKTELDGTTLEVYTSILKEACALNGYDEEQVFADYQEQLDYIKLNDNPIFRRILMCLPENWKANAAKTMYFRAAQMEAAQAMGEDLPAKLNRYECHWRCPFKWVCAAQDDGADWRELLDATFTKDKERFDAK